MPEPSLDSWTIIFTLAAAQGIFLSIIFFIKRNKQPVILLNVLVLLFSITLIDYIAFWTNYRYIFPHISRVSVAFPFLFGPLFYLYIRSFLKTTRLSKKDALHIIPFILYVLIQSPFYLLNGERKIAILLNRQFLPIYEGALQSALIFIISIVPLLMVVHLVTYCALSFRLIAKTGFKNIGEELNKYLNILRYSFLGFVLSFTAYYVMVYLFSYDREYDYAISVAMSLFIYCIGYLGYVSPKVFTGSLKDHLSKEKYSNSGLTQLDAYKIKRKLVHLMESEKLYLNSDLKLNDLAKTANESKHHVSQVLNDELNTSFSAFVNEYRIKESQKLLADRTKELNMYGIARESGFNNKTTFSLAFKRHTGLSPSNYKEKEV